MIVSMILQAVYNIVDTAFVINMGEDGIAGNLALTYAFPVQLLMIAFGVGTGVGINALLSKSLGEGDRKKAAALSATAYFWGCAVFAVFLLVRPVRSKAVLSPLCRHKRKSCANGRRISLDLLCIFLWRDRVYRIRTLFTGDRARRCIRP